MFLVDASALVRLVRGQVDRKWQELADRGFISVCEPALAQTLVIADAKEYARLETSITGSCRSCENSGSARR